MQAASGRNFAGQRFGPRPLDLDIIFYSNQHVQHDRLCIPHPRWQERDFVKVPLLDLFTPEEDLSHSPWQGLAEKLAAVRNIWRPNQGSVHCLYKSIFWQPRCCWHLRQLHASSGCNRTLNDQTRQ